MISDDTIHDSGNLPAVRHTQPIGIPSEWDDDTLASLKDDDHWPDPGFAPTTLSELVLAPRYTQSEWDRRQVRKLQLVTEAETYLWENLEHKTPQVLVRDALLILGYTRAAEWHMNPDRPPPVNVVLEGKVYPALELDERIMVATAPPRTVAAEDEHTVYAAMLAPAPVKAKPRRRPSQARKTVTGGK